MTTNPAASNCLVGDFVTTNSAAGASLVGDCVTSNYAARDLFRLQGDGGAGHSRNPVCRSDILLSLYNVVIIRRFINVDMIIIDIVSIIVAYGASVYKRYKRNTSC